MPQRIDYPTGLKACRACGVAKPLGEFYTVKARGGAPASRCKSCFSATKPSYQRKLTTEARACDHCGSTFTPKKRPDTAKYCSRRCGQTAWSRAKGVRPIGIVVVDGCRQCTSCNEWKPLDQFGRRADRNNAPLSNCRQCLASLAQRYHGGERGRSMRYARKYGVSIEWYEAKLIEQNGACAICGRPPDMGNRMHPRLAIDHCHESGAARGLLCFLCNSAIGRFADDPDLLLRAHEYLTAARN